MTTPTTALAVPTNDSLPIARQVFGDERMSLIRALLPQNPTAADLADIEQFAIIVQRTHLDFFARPPQIYAIRRWDSKQRREVLTAQASIDSFRLVAARTREYQGQVGPFWCGEDEVWKDVWLSSEHPKAARVGVRRKGFAEPIWSVAVWDRVKQEVDEYQGNTKTGGKKLAPFWEKMGPEMLAKTAETNALKRAFPNDTEGLELAAIEAEARAAQPDLANRYTEIWGSEEDHDQDGIPPRALNAAVDMVDTRTGEVLKEGGDAAGEDSAGAPPPADPQRAEMVAMYDTLLGQAVRDGVVTAGDKKWLLGSRDGVVEVISKGRELRALVNAAQIERARGGVVPFGVEESRKGGGGQSASTSTPAPEGAAGDRLETLRMMAKKRGLKADLKVEHWDVDAEIAYWDARIEQHDLDQQAQKQSEVPV